jgi:release factor glutamine methyltransferase
MTLDEWLNKSDEMLAKVGIGSSRRDSEIILKHVLNKESGYLFAHGDEALTTEQEEQADALIARRSKNEPIAYLVGSKEFFGLRFKTDSRGLIPRWETELIVEKSLEWLKIHGSRLIIADIGTGIGTIVCTLASHYPMHRFYATDSSKNAIILAQENAHNLGVSNITFLTGNLAEPLLHSRLNHKINLITANLPYIRTNLLTELDPTIKYFEPDIALNGGSDGLDLYRACIPQLKDLVATDSYLLFEHDHDQGAAMRQIIFGTFPEAKIETHKDNLGHDRVTSVTPRQSGEEDDDID